eukprot:TRINITY_DN14949_c0_g2_i2.p1 TRINITY_DN14949_c0_g2~~TRINITY_DN14949_c0_g2_i2.p1  ORF type:complete len:1346 (+),score=249.16 TRINITY_DN14949_c0_g2_i2:527-4039(+)
MENAAAEELGAVLAAPRCALTALDLSFTCLGPEVVRILSECFSANCTLTSLRFDHCRLREEANVILESISDPACCMPLRALGLARNALPEASFWALAALLESAVGQGLRELDVSGNPAASEEACGRALGCVLVTGWTGRVGARTSASCGANAAGLVPPLPLGDRDQERVAMSGDLRLNLSGTRPFFNAALGRWDVAPHTLTALRHPACRVSEVVLDNCTFSDAAMPTLARVCLNVTSFSMCGQPLGEIFVQSLSELARAAGNQRRSCRAAAVAPALLHEDDGPTTRSGPPSTAAGIGSSATTGGASSSRGPRLRLRELRLNDAQLQDTGAGALAVVLANLRAARRDGGCLEVLEIAGNHFTPEALESLLPELAVNEQLRRLVLSRNKLRQAGAVLLADWLRQRGVVEPDCAAALDLELCHCALTAGGCLEVWDALLVGRVASIDLADNSLDSSTAAALRAALYSANAAVDTRLAKKARHRCAGRQRAQPPGSPDSCACRSASASASTPPSASASPQQQRLCGAPGARSPGARSSGARSSSLGSRPSTPHSSPQAQGLWLSLADDDWDEEQIASGDKVESTDERMLLTRAMTFPNPAGSSDEVELFVGAAPWKTIELRGATVDAPTVAQLLYSLGDKRQLELQNRRESKEFALSLTGCSLFSRHWHWSVITDAIGYALAPHQLVGARQRPWPRADGLPWRRLGGLGGALRLDLDRCELFRGNFTLPRTLVPSPAQALCSSTKSLARSARREVSSKARGNASDVSCNQPPQPRVSLASRARGHASPGLLGVVEAGDAETSAGTGADLPWTTQVLERAEHIADGFIDVNGRTHVADVDLSLDSSSVVAQPKVGKVSGPTVLCAQNRTTMTQFLVSGGKVMNGASAKQYAESSGTTNGDSNAGRSYVRSGQPEVNVAVVLRQLRGLESVRITRCRFTDRQMAQLCHSGASSKWSGVRTLDLRDNLLTAKCCGAIAAVVAGGLECLILDGNRLKAEGFQALCAAMVKPGQRCALRWLSVADNDIRHPGGAAAAGLLAQKDSCVLQGLSLARNPGLSSPALAEILRALSHHGEDERASYCGASAGGRALELLDLSGSGADAALLPALARALAQCKELVVCLHGSPLALQAQTRSAELGSSSVGANTAERSELLAQLARHPRLRLRWLPDDGKRRLS